MDNILETIEYRGFQIAVYPDTDAESPVKSMDMVGTMVCWHKRYSMGHEQPRENPDEWLRDQMKSLDYRKQEWLWGKLGLKFDETEDKGSWDLFEDWLDEANIGKLMEAFQTYNVVLPIYMYDHSGQTINTTGFSDPWDSGQLGFIYADHEKVLKEWGDGTLKVVTPALIDKAQECLKGEVETYDMYITGQVVGYRILDAEGEEVDWDSSSCWGFYGQDYMVSEVKSIIDYQLDGDKQVA